MPLNLDDRISSDKAKEIYKEQLLNEETRRHVRVIIDEYVACVPFMKKVQEYAAEEMDRRVFRSARYWMVVVFTAILTSLIGGAIAYFLFRD